MIGTYLITVLSHRLFSIFFQIHQYMTGRIKFVDATGSVIRNYNEPEIPYEYEQATAYEESCGTYGVSGFQLPNPQCPSKFVCDAPASVAEFAGCIESMNCAMTAGMTTGASSDNAMALFVHQMVPHHQNAVNMAKALLAGRILDSCTCEYSKVGVSLSLCRSMHSYSK